MDYIKEHSNVNSTRYHFFVSILVVMDYIKEQKKASNFFEGFYSFNPCCDGLYKRTQNQMETPCLWVLGFNPCCDGLYKRTRLVEFMNKPLILFQSLL